MQILGEDAELMVNIFGQKDNYIINDEGEFTFGVSDEYDFDPKLSPISDGAYDITLILVNNMQCSVLGLRS